MYSLFSETLFSNHLVDEMKLPKKPLRVPGGPGALTSFSFLPWPQVEYLSDGFLEKNRDTVYEEQINILKASKVKSGRVRKWVGCPGPDQAGYGWCQPCSAVRNTELWAGGCEGFPGYFTLRSGG